jgi:hypothetical protein
MRPQNLATDLVGSMILAPMSTAGSSPSKNINSVRQYAGAATPHPRCSNYWYLRRAEALLQTTGALIYAGGTISMALPYSPALE